MISLAHTASAARAPRTASALAAAGVLLGICAGLVQLLAGSSIPEWTGNKMDPAGLGLTTIVLSLVAGAALWQLRRPLPGWARVCCTLAGVACAAVCFSTVGRLWYVPGTLLLLATLLSAVAAPVTDAEPPATDAGRPSPDAGRPADFSRPEGDEQAAPARSSLGAWIVFALGVVAGVAVAAGSLLTVLIGRGPSSVAVAAAVLLAGGLALSAAVAPGLRRRVPAMLAAGSGAGLMAGGLLLACIAVIIAFS
jgi:hypothetical protein